MPKKEDKIPLPQSFFVTSILGIIISTGFMISGKLSPTWGVAFLVIFCIMFVASFTSATPDRNDVK